MKESVANMLECAGHVTRRYQNKTTGDNITLTIIVGPPGPTAVHTPEICYSSRSYSIKENRKRVNLDSAQSGPNPLWQATFRSNRIATDILHAYYAWSTGESWQASKNPRYQFGGLPLLYKIQIAGTVEADGKDPGKQFLEALFQSDWNLSSKQPPAEPAA